MHVIKTVSELKQCLTAFKNISFVPTMCNLHAGHMALFEEAYKKSEGVVFSIFINRIQFNDSNDFINYPRTLANDVSLIKKKFPSAIIFHPEENELYFNHSPKEFALGKVVEDLCGRSRPGHFQGVATIIDIFLAMINPKYLFLGKKDYQQLCVIENFCKIYYPHVTVIPIRTIRDANNLALSSRNNLLKDKMKAANLYKILSQASQAIKSLSDIQQQTKLAKEQLVKENWQNDYVEVRTQKKLTHPKDNDKELIILAAVYCEKIRLIDNIEFCIE